MKSLGILIAMREELAPLRKHWKLDPTGPGEFYTGRWAGLRLQVALSGVGGHRAERAVDLLKRYGQPDMLVSLGYSGALQSDLKAGQAVLATRVESPGSEPWLSAPGTSHEDAVAHWRRGPLLCVDQIVQQKQAHPHCLAVDMESAAVARSGLPWKALRIIIDPLDTPLPLDFARCLDDQGQTDPKKLAWQIAKNPGRWPHLTSFAQLAARAREQLVEQSSLFLEVQTPW